MCYIRYVFTITRNIFVLNWIGKLYYSHLKRRQMKLYAIISKLLGHVYPAESGYMIHTYISVSTAGRQVDSSTVGRYLA